MKNLKYYLAIFPVVFIFTAGTSLIVWREPDIAKGFFVGFCIIIISGLFLWGMEGLQK